jgi:hypothetical protein
LGYEARGTHRAYQVPTPEVQTGRMATRHAVSELM